MKKELSVLVVILLVTMLVACTNQDKLPGQEDEPNERVPQFDEFNDPGGVEKLDNIEKNSVDENDDFIQGNKPTQEEITYKDDVKPILEENCINCHQQRSVVGEENIFEDYQGVMKFVNPRKPESSKLLTSIQDDASMRKYIGADEIEIINHWVKTGARK